MAKGVRKINAVMVKRRIKVEDIKVMIPTVLDFGLVFIISILKAYI